MILIADGALQLTVSSIKNPNSVICTVNNTASITEHKTVYIVGVDTFKQEFLTEKDREYILFGIKHGFFFAKLQEKFFFQKQNKNY